MSTNESPTKRKTDIQGSDSANKRRSLRDRSTIISPTADAGKLSPMELIGSLTFDIAKSEEGWTVKDHRNGITKTFTSKDGKTFDSFEAIGEFSIASKDWMEELVDDEGAIDALQQLARDGDERATCALETLGIALEEDEEDDDDEDDDSHHTSSPAAKRNSKGAGGTQSKKNRFVIGLSKSDYNIPQGEITKFQDKMGEFFTASAEMFFANFLTIVTQAESKLKAKNAPVFEEIESLELELEDADGKQPLKKVHCALEEKRDLVQKRKKYHEKQIRALVKELGETFLPSGFDLPEHLVEKHDDLLSNYPVLKKVAFPTLKASTTKKKA